MALSQYLTLTTVPGLIAVVASSCTIYLCTLFIYRIYFHPLSHIPGPTLAAATFFYEFYWDVVQPGRFVFHLQDLHDRYGPIVRVAPDEVHVRDSGYFDELYARSSSSTGKRHKSPRFSGRFGFKAEAFSTWQHDLHRVRRAAINPFFSVQKVTNLQPVLRSTLTKLTRRLEEAAEAGSTVPINLAYTALTGDIISAYCFARSNNQTESPGFRDTYEDALKALFTIGNVCLHFPVIFKMIDICPPRLTQILNPVVMPIVHFYADRERDIREIRTGINKGHETAENPTVFHEMLRSPVLPQHEKTDRRLAEEAVEIVAAGIITTSFALTVGTYHLAVNPKLQQRLRDELRDHVPDPLNLSDLSADPKSIDWHALEKLPYLSGTVRESIRLSGGVIARSPRIAPDETLRYGSYSIPPGFAVSMTSYDIAHDPAIFPDSPTFDPMRWIRQNDGSKNVEMDRWVVAFGKGARQCAGINLAFAEMYIVLAVLFCSFEFEVAEDTSWERDVKVKHAYLVPYPELDSKGVKVRVRRLDV